jgi:hypothetical protein
MVDKERYLGELAAHPSARFWRVDFTELTVPERVFAAIWELEAQVSNGGFHQFYFNSTGDIAYFSPTALETIGANDTAEIVAKANSFFPNSQPAVETVRRRQQLEVINLSGSGCFDELDERFYEHPNNLTELLYDYVVAHRDEIAGA